MGGVNQRFDELRRDLAEEFRAQRTEATAEITAIRSWAWTWRDRKKRVDTKRRGEVTTRALPGTSSESKG